MFSLTSPLQGLAALDMLPSVGHWGPVKFFDGGVSQNASGPVTVSDGAIAGHIGRGENPTVAGRKSHRNPTMQRGWGIALEGSFPYASAISVG